MINIEKEIFETIIVDDVNDKETEVSIETINVDDEGGGGGLGFIAGSALSYLGMGYLGYKITKLLILRPLVNKVTASLIQLGVKKGAEVAVKKGAQGIFKRLIQRFFFNKATQAATQGMLASIKGGLLAIKGALLSAANTILAFLTSAAGITVGVIAVGVFVTLYLAGNSEMKEIFQIWKDGRHGPNKGSDAKEVYKNVSAGLYAAKLVGISFLKYICSKYPEGHFIIRIKDEKNSEQYIEDYFTKMDFLGEALAKSDLMTNIFAGEKASDWVDEIEKEYAGLQVSGRKKTDNYDIMKAYVIKYMLEDESAAENYYKKELAEEAEGWFSTFFDNFIPGMSILGWSSWMISESYINNINTLVDLKQRPWLWEVAKTYWTYKVKDLSIEDFSIDDFAKLSKRITGKDSIVSNPNFLKQLEYGYLTEEGQYFKEGTFEELLKRCGKYVTHKSMENAQNSKAIPVTNLTMSFSALYATYSLLFNIYEGAVTYLALMQLVGSISDAERKILGKYKVDDEYDSGEIVDQGDTGSKAEKEKEEKKDTSAKAEISADEIIKTFAEKPEFKNFPG